jgi:hypothetical protein
MNKNDNGVTGESVVPSSRDSAHHDGGGEALLMTSVAEAAASENAPPSAGLQIIAVGCIDGYFKLLYHCL